MDKCELCELREYTQHYARFTHPVAFTILDCDSCDTPMAVLGEHRATATEAERALIESSCIQYAISTTVAMVTAWAIRASSPSGSLMSRSPKPRA